MSQSCSKMLRQYFYNLSMPYRREYCRKLPLVICKRVLPAIFLEVDLERIIISTARSSFTAQELTKSSYRRKVWDYMTKNELVNFPVNIYGRIPNFKGAAEAAQHLAELNEFKKARAIKINPDKPQEPVRFLALEANKEIIVPIPRLRSGLFLHITPVAGATKEQLKTLASMRGQEQAGKPLGLDSRIKVNIFVSREDDLALGRAISISLKVRSVKLLLLFTSDRSRGAGIGMRQSRWIPARQG